MHNNEVVHTHPESAAGNGETGTPDCKQGDTDIGSHHSSDAVVNWRRSALIEGTASGRMPRPWLAKWGWWLLPFSLLALWFASLFGIRHIQAQVLTAAPQILNDADIDTTMLEFSADYRNVLVDGVLPAGVSPQQMQRLLEHRNGPDGERIRQARVIAREISASAVSGTDSPSETVDSTVLTATATATTKPLSNNADSPAVTTDDSTPDPLPHADQDDLRGEALSEGQQIVRQARIASQQRADTLQTAAPSADSARVVNRLSLADNRDNGVGAAVNARDSTPDPLAQADQDDVRVEVFSEGQHIVLQGRLASQQQADTLQAAAASAVGDARVVNRLSVTAPERRAAEAGEGGKDQTQHLASVLSNIDSTTLAANLLLDDNSLSGTIKTSAAESLTRMSAAVAGNDVTIITPYKAEPLSRQTPAAQNLSDETRLLQQEINSLQQEIRNNVAFEFASAQLKEKAYPTLDKVVDAMNKYSRPGVEINGHTDWRAAGGYNLDLSVRRAQAVQSYLQSRGIPLQRLRAMGAGEIRPLASNRTSAGRRQNRRVEFIAREPY